VHGRESLKLRHARVPVRPCGWARRRGERGAGMVGELGGHQQTAAGGPYRSAAAGADARAAALERSRTDGLADRSRSWKNLRIAPVRWARNSTPRDVRSPMTLLSDVLT
jgi:hypothetical protein